MASYTTLIFVKLFKGLILEFLGNSSGLETQHVLHLCVDDKVMKCILNNGIKQVYLGEK